MKPAHAILPVRFPAVLRRRPGARPLKRRPLFAASTSSLRQLLRFSAEAQCRRGARVILNLAKPLVFKSQDLRVKVAALLLAFNDILTTCLNNSAKSSKCKVNTRTGDKPQEAKL